MSDWHKSLSYISNIILLRVFSSVFSIGDWTIVGKYGHKALSYGGCVSDGHKALGYIAQWQ